MFNIFRKKKNSKKSTIAQEFIQQEKTTSADNDTEDKKDQHNQASINDKKAINLFSDALSNLNEEQKKAVCFEGKHLLVLAGAGTGKTKTIISRALYLVEHGVQPSRILILSFTRKSASEIVNRIKLLNSKSIGITGQTFHSWCMGMIQGYPNIFNCSGFTCLDEEDRESAIKLLCGKKFRDKDDKGIKPSQIIDVYSYARNAKCSLSESIRVKIYDNGCIDDLRDSINRNKPIYEDVIRKYINYKKEHRYIDYDDILNIVSSILKNNPEAAKRISAKYDHILVDEMQDTNPLQYELLSSFYMNCHLFCVGDDAQSIYGFRGADFKTIHSFTDIVKDSESMKLSLNYRSTQEILDLSNWVISQSPLRYDKKLKSYRGNGDKPKLIYIDNEWDEANHITDDILIGINEQGCEYSDNLVLSRTNWGLRKVEASCLSKNIPYQVFGGTSLMQSKHVRDVMSALRIASNFRDELAWIRYLQLWQGIGNARSARIIQALFECLTFSECTEKLRVMNLQDELCLTLEKLDGLQFNPSKAIKEAVRIMSPRLSILYKDNGWEGRKKDFELLANIANDRGSIDEFIAEFILDPKLGTYNKKEGRDENVVTLSTIHSAKGLEAKNCYIVNVSPLAYPTQRAILNGTDAIEEERRCLYVALTRAKDKLYLYKDIHGTSIAYSAGNSFFNEEINPGMVFVNKRSKEHIKVISIKNVRNVSMVEFVLLDNPTDKNVSFKKEEYDFREMYDTEDAINKDPASYYFLNEIPSSIVDIENISSYTDDYEDDENNDNYTKSIIDDFNFE